MADDIQLVCLESSDDDELSSNSNSNDENDKYFEVEEIVDERVSYTSGKVEYLIKWEGYHSEENTWEDASSIRKGALEAVFMWEEYKIRAAEYSKGIGRDPPNSQNQRKRKDSTCGSFTSRAVSPVPTSSLHHGTSSSPVKKTRVDVDEDQGQETDGVNSVPSEKEQQQSLEETIGLSPLDCTTAINTKFEEFKTFVLTEMKKPVSQSHESIPLTGNLEECLKKANATLYQEVENLRRENAQLQTVVNTLELFRLCRKDPEKLLEKQLQEQKTRLKSGESELAILMERVQEKQEKIQVLENTVNEAEQTLETVAQIFSSILNVNVLINQVKDTFPQVQAIIAEMTKKANTLDCIKSFLR